MDSHPGDVTWLLKAEDYELDLTRQLLMLFCVHQHGASRQQQLQEILRPVLTQATHPHILDGTALQPAADGKKSQAGGWGAAHCGCNCALPSTLAGVQSWKRYCAASCLYQAWPN